MERQRVVEEERGRHVLDECSFHPDIVDSQRIVAGAVYGPAHTRTTALQWQRERDNNFRPGDSYLKSQRVLRKMDLMRQEKEEMEVAECTFRPKIDKRSQYLISKYYIIKVITLI